MFVNKIVSSADRTALLNVRRLPGRLTTSQSAVILGFQEHDIPVLVDARLLTPLGKPVANAPKYFAAVDILGAAADPEWLGKATRTISKRWQEKNQRRRPTMAQAA
jgi:hypothetical protein